MSRDKLLITPKEKIEEWKEIVESVLKKGDNIIVICDTETTGGVMSTGCSVREKENKDYLHQMHRIVEIGAIICVLDKKTNKTINLTDSSGSPIFFQEYLNFLNEEESQLIKYNSIREMPYGAWRVHGISLNFLNGKERLGESLALHNNEKYFIPLPPNHGKTLLLPSSAPTFEDVCDSFKDICGLNFDFNSNETKARIIFLAHNHEFDAKFLNAEFSRIGQPTMESLTLPMDSIVLAKGLFSTAYIKNFKDEKREELAKNLKEKNYNEAQIKKIISENIPTGLYSLDSLSYVLQERGLMTLSGIDRNLHGAALDSEILRRVYTGLLASEEYKTSPNRPNADISMSLEIKEMLLKKGKIEGGVKPINRPMKLLTKSKLNSLK